MNSEGLTQSTEEFVLVNIVEEVVRAKVREAIRDVDMCQCKKCELNACAIALNNLRPRYVTTKKGHLLAKIGLMNQDYLMEVSIEVAKALKMVIERPLHDKQP
jgi:competence protein ComFB